MSIYTRLYDFLAGATVRSQEFDDEFNAIATHSRTTIRAVDEVDADLPAASSRANKLLSFDASGQPQATNSVPDPVADADVANKRWVQTLAISATIPVVPSNAGKYMYTDGVSAVWAFATAGSVVFTPTGGISANNVQSALVELDTEKAPLGSPALSGTPTTPLPAVDSSSDQIASTRFYANQASSVVPLADGLESTGVSLRFARQDHVHPENPAVFIDAYVNFGGF